MGRAYPIRARNISLYRVAGRATARAIGLAHELLRDHPSPREEAGMTDSQHKGSDENAEIEDAVIAYLHDHPDAADTLDGILQWWLPQQRYETARASIEDALARLVNAGLLRREHLPGDIDLYALKQFVKPRPRTH
jgi:hypothetical protein